MIRGEQLGGLIGGYSFSGKVSATRPAENYTARVIPYKHGVAVPLEAAQILWQK
jgi:starch phosphorylase